MGSNILREIQQLFENKKESGGNIPLPSYLFVQRYGREIQEDMEEITAWFGRKEWFPFYCVNIKNGEKLLTGFKMELGRYATVGKEYAGCVLIEFSGEEEEKEIENLLDYIDSQNQRLQCIYTVKAVENVRSIKKILENYGFVRVVQGEEYNTDEQIKIFEDTLKTYSFRLEKEAKERIAEFFKSQKWQEGDMVKIRIQNIAKEMVYTKVMEEGYKEKNIKKKDVDSVLCSLKLEKIKKRQMGFVMGGNEA